MVKYELQMSRTSALVVMLAAALAGPATAHARQNPTLGELAQKEQQRRQGLIAPAKVLTNQDLPRAVVPRPPVPADPSGLPPAAVGDEKSKPEEKPQEPAKDEAWWRQRTSQVREELRRNEMFAEALQTRINSLTSDFTARDDPYQRAQIGEERAKAIAELDRVKADAELSRKKIAEIEEEARRAGVPPGWLR
jgi:hypothetical protein